MHRSGGFLTVLMGAVLLATTPASAFDGRFEDDDGDVHEAAIDAVAREGVASGCVPSRYCPDGLLTRGQLATMLARALILPPATLDVFSDDNGNPHEDAINRVAAAGIVTGRGGTTFDPDGVVTRAAMAAFLARGVGLRSGDVDPFVDDDGNVHEQSINAVARHGIASGCSADQYCPDAPVRRDQMASFLARALGLIAKSYPPGLAPPAYIPTYPPPMPDWENFTVRLSCRRLADDSFVGAMYVLWPDGHEEYSYGPGMGRFTTVPGDRGSRANFDAREPAWPVDNGCQHTGYSLGPGRP